MDSKSEDQGLSGMKVSIKNLGAIKKADFTLGEMTILCGGNNTGKTYATYALFGFLSYWRDDYEIMIPDGDVQRLLNEGRIDLDIQEYIDQAQHLLNEACLAYMGRLSRVFASKKKYFEKSSFTVHLSSGSVIPLEEFDVMIGAVKGKLLSISKKEGSSELVVSLLVEKENVKIPREIISKVIGDALKEIVFGHVFARPFMASAERTGAAIFRKELNFARNRLLGEMSSMDEDVDPRELLSKVYSDYALPVKLNVDFTRQLEGLSKQESYVSRLHPEILEDFTDIIGGDYLVTDKDELYFVPKNNRIQLTMDESSSAVRSLLDIGFYLRHVARPGDLLMVDEPELNLHPENQRRVARLLVRIVNSGIRVFITTHSDYIIKELNILIMLNQDSERLKALAERENYKAAEMLSADKVKVYIAEENSKVDAKRKTKGYTLVQAGIDSQYGIEARSFDQTIDDMNRIQDEIVWGGGE